MKYKLDEDRKIKTEFEIVFVNKIDTMLRGEFYIVDAKRIGGTRGTLLEYKRKKLFVTIFL